MGWYIDQLVKMYMPEDRARHISRFTTVLVIILDMICNMGCYIFIARFLIFFGAEHLFLVFCCFLQVS